MTNIILHWYLIIDHFCGEKGLQLRWLYAIIYGYSRLAVMMYNYNKRQDMNTPRSIGGITIGNSWLRNNPNLRYPEGHEFMTDSELKAALRFDYPEPPIAAMLSPKSNQSRKK